MAITQVTENGLTFWQSDASTGYVLAYKLVDGAGEIIPAGGLIQTLKTLEEIETLGGSIDRLVELGLKRIVKESWVLQYDLETLDGNIYNCNYEVDYDTSEVIELFKTESKAQYRAQELNLIIS